MSSSRSLGSARSKSNPAVTEDSSVRDKIYLFFNHPTMLLVMSTLLFVDITCVILGISFEIQYSDSEVSDLEDVVDSCQEQLLEQTYELNACEDDDIGNQYYQRASRAMFWTSIVVLSIFAVEGLLLIFAKPLTFFFDKGRMLDFIVVVISLVLEIVLDRSTVAGLIVIARVWRFVRITNGVHGQATKECDTCQERGKMLYQLDGLNEDRAVVNAYEAMLAGGSTGNIDSDLAYNLLHIVGASLLEKEEREKELLEGEEEYQPPSQTVISMTPGRISKSTKTSNGDVYTKMF